MNELFARRSSEDLAAEAMEIVLRAKEHFRPKATFALFSGGADSTAMLRIVRDHIDYAVHIRTGIGIPSTFDHVRAVCESWKVPLIVLDTPPEEYRRIILAPKAKGFPGPVMHFVCYHRLKQRRIRELQRSRSAKGERLLLLSGVRRAESRRRALSVARGEKGVMGRSDHDARRCIWVNPLVSADSIDMTNLRESMDISLCEASQRIHKSGECLCGAFGTQEELREIEFWFPKTGAEIRALEAEARAMGKPYPIWGHHSRALGQIKQTGMLCQGCSLFTVHEDVEKSNR